MIPPQHVRRRRKRIPWIRWAIFTIGACCFLAGTIALLLSIGNIIVSTWSFILPAVLNLCGVLITLFAWLFPLPPGLSDAPVLPRAMELVRESFQLGDDTAANFPYIMKPIQSAYAATQRALLDASRGAAGAKGGVIILGEANAGKTRLAFEALTQSLPRWPVLRWRPDYTLDKAPTAELPHSQGIVIFIDDLQDYVPVHMKDDDRRDLTADPRITTLHTLFETVRQDVRGMVVVATCRLENETQVRAGLGQLFTKLVVVPLHRFSVDVHDPEAAEIIADFQRHGSTHIGDWDGTLGSLVLGLSTKNQEYLKLRATPAATVLRAMKLLTRAHTLMHTEQRLRVVCAEVFGEKALHVDDKTWQEAVDQLVQEQFITEEEDKGSQATLLLIRKDTYFDQVITDYPAPNRPRQLVQDLVRLLQVLVRLRDVSALVNLGLAFHESERHDEALATYEQAVLLDTHYAGAYNNRGNALADLKRYDEALVSYEQALRLDPQLALIFTNKGQTLATLKRYDEALVVYDQALRLDPEDAPTYNSKGATLIELGRYDEALAAFEQATHLEPDDAAAYNNQGLALAHLKRYEEALAAYEQAVKLDPNHVGTYNNKGQALADLKRYEEAVAAFELSLRLVPDDARVYNDKGIALAELKRYDEAVAVFEQVLQLDPNYTMAHINRGRTLTILKRYEEALAAYDQAIKLDPKEVLAYSNKGCVLALLKRDDEALVAYEQAIELDQGHVSTHVYKGDALSDLNQYKEALDAYEQAIRLAPAHVEAYYGKGVALAHLNRYEEALAAFEQALHFDPNDASAYINKGQILADLKRCDEALAAYERAIELAPNEAQAYYKKGSTLAKLKRYEEALHAYEQAIHLDPGDPDFYHNKGIALYSTQPV